MDDAYEPPLLLSPDSVAGVFRTAHTIFPHLSVMKVNIVNLRKPLVSLTVQDLTLFIDRPTYGDNNRLAAVSLRRTAHLVLNVVTLRIDAEEHVRQLGPSLSRFCQALPKLNTVILAPSALSVPLFEALSGVRSLVSIRMLECARTSRGGYVYEHGTETRWPDSLTCSDCFPNLRDLAFSCAGPQGVRHILRGTTFARRLVTLWIRFPDALQLHPLEVKEVIESLSKMCLSLEGLTLRFAACSPVALQGFPYFFPLRFADIEPFLSFQRLRSFSIDHSLPLQLTDSDLVELSARAGPFERLWLNPYPPVRSVDDLDGLPGIQCLEHFARHCPSLKRLGILVDARTALAGVGGHCRFLRLRELFVGWSMITSYEEAGCGRKWESLAGFLFELMPAGSQISTVQLQSDEEILSLVSSEMRAMGGVLWDHNVEIDALSRSWRSVWAMVLFLRSISGSTSRFIQQ